MNLQQSPLLALLAMTPTTILMILIIIISTRVKLLMHLGHTHCPHLPPTILHLALTHSLLLPLALNSMVTSTTRIISMKGE